VLGSRATLLAAAWGGFEGRPIRAGDVLPVGVAMPGERSFTARPTVSDPPDPALVLVTPGPHLARFPRESWDQLLAETWHVSPRSDRVGVRLEGAKIARQGEDRAPPAPMVRGAIQITTDGTPIVLGPDHPVTGGYPVLAVIGRASQALLARLRPKRALRFVVDESAATGRSSQ
jgi:allophanate hydrolase subunit 2